MTKFTIDLNFSPQEFQKYYSKPGIMVWVESLEGDSIQFPASILHPYISHSGLQGRFIVEVDQNNHFLSIKRQKSG